VSEQVHNEISTLVTGTQNVIVMIGNPTTTSGTFYEAFKRPDIWKCIRISCLEHPNVMGGKEIFLGAVTQEWIDERRAMWGENHPFWFSRVLGEFPRISNKGVIPLGWIERAQNEESRIKSLREAESARIPRIAGLDVARYGENECVLTIRRGDAVEQIIAWHHKALTETAGMALRFIKELDIKLMIVDASGIGAGVVDMMYEQSAPILAYNGGHRAFTPASYSNRRTEMWWHIRTRLEHQRLWLPPEHSCGKLVGDLVAPEYEINASGRLKVQTKEQLLDSGKKSPDYADSLVLCFAVDEDPEAFLQESAGGSGVDPWVRREQEIEEHGEESPFSQLPWGM
jgi:hypothetical protein